MKNLKIIALALITFAAQSAFAARMSVYNETGSDVNIVAHTTQGALPVKTIPANGKFTFDSGIHSFKSIVWVENRYPSFIYSFRTPSTRVMLTGEARLQPQGRGMLNFDENGASSKKWTNITASRTSRWQNQ